MNHTTYGVEAKQLLILSSALPLTRNILKSELENYPKFIQVVQKTFLVMCIPFCTFFFSI